MELTAEQESYVNLLVESLMRFYQEDARDLFTSGIVMGEQSAVDERTMVGCISHHMRNLIRKDEYLTLEPNVDIEYDRMFADEQGRIKKSIDFSMCDPACPQYSKCAVILKEKLSDDRREKSIRPDIIVHRRNSDSGMGNGMIVEFKKGKPGEFQSDYDMAKITACICPKGRFHYLVGAYVELYQNNAELSVYSSVNSKLLMISFMSVDLFGEIPSRGHCFQGCSLMTFENSSRHTHVPLKKKKARLFKHIVSSGLCKWPVGVGFELYYDGTMDRSWGDPTPKPRKAFPQPVSSCNDDICQKEAAIIAEYPDLLPLDQLHPLTLFYMLKKAPHLGQYYKWENLKTNRYDSEKWIDLLCECSSIAEYFHFERLTGAGWVSLLSKSPQYAEKCQWDLLNASDWTRLLSANPVFSGNCDWNKLKGSDWIVLLTAQPQFVNKCKWGSLSDEQLSGFLSAHPDMAVHCLESITGSQWRVILRLFPKFMVQCPFRSFDADTQGRLLIDAPSLGMDSCDWQPERISAAVWVEILSARPCFANYCKWDIFNGDDLCKIVSAQPSLESKIDWRKILTATQWCQVLSKQPQFAKHCNIWDIEWDYYEEFHSSRSIWPVLLITHPKDAQKWFEEEYNSSLSSVSRYLYRLGRNGLLKVLQALPECAKWIKWDIFSVCDDEYWNDRGTIDCVIDFWPKLLKTQPKFIEYCDIRKVNSRNLVEIILLMPSMIEKCDLQILKPSDWIRLLKEHPEWVDKCDFSKFTEDDHYNGRHNFWPDLLIVRPEFGNLCEWKFFSEKDWVKLLAFQPQFANACKLDNFYESNLYRILSAHPQLSRQCDLHKIDWHTSLWNSFVKEHKSFTVILGIENDISAINLSFLNGRAWADLLIAHPQFANLCKWEELDGRDWCSLLKTHPQFADFCDWDKLYTITTTKNSKGQYPTKMISQEISSWWGDLLLVRPEFAKYCKVWDKPFAFDAWEWFNLLDIPEILEHLTLYPSLHYVHNDTYEVTICDGDFAKIIEDSHGTRIVKSKEGVTTNRYDYDDEYPDWRDVSGWNEAYGDADPADFIEY